MTEESEAPAAGSALPSCDCGLMIETHTTLTMSAGVFSIGIGSELAK